MKNLVSLMRKTNSITECLSNLSFSSVFLRDKNLAHLCLELDDEFKNTRDEIYRTIFSLRGVKKDELITITDMMEIQSDIIDSFSSRAKLVLDKRPLHPVVNKVIDDEERRAFVVKVGEGSSMENKSLLELRLRQKAGATVMAIKRRNKWIVQLNSKDRVKQDDMLVCFGNKKSENLVRKVSTGKLEI